jgi:hypothetical protein
LAQNVHIPIAHARTLLNLGGNFPPPEAGCKTVNGPFRIPRFCRRRHDGHFAVAQECVDQVCFKISSTMIHYLPFIDKLFQAVDAHPIFHLSFVNQGTLELSESNLLDEKIYV